MKEKVNKIEKTKMRISDAGNKNSLLAFLE